MSKPIAGRSTHLRKPHTCIDRFGKSSCAECVADERRLILDAFHSRQATRYLELLRTIPAEGLPKSGPELVADYLEFLTTP